MITGSYIAPETPHSHVESMRVFTPQGIMAKHDLRPHEFEKIRIELYNKKLGDILFHFPDGPRYDMALYLVASSR